MQRILLRVGAFILFHFGWLGLINLFINRYRPKKNANGKLVFPFIAKRPLRNVQILAYHRVNDDNDPFFHATSIDLFAKQMDYMACHFNVLSLEEAIGRMKDRDIPNNAVVVTFDDGYRDNYLNAFPILRGLSIPATIFLATNGIDSRRVLWFERVFSAFRETKVFFLKSFGPDSKDYALRSLEEKVIAQQEVLRTLRAADDSERPLLVDRLINLLEVEDRKEASDLMLRWDEIRAMRQDGISFGSHTVTHPILSRLPIDKVRVEIYESKRIIEEKLGVPVRAFAYPSGRKIDFNEMTKGILREAGYGCALTIIFGTNQIGQDLFELRRLIPWEKGIGMFGVRLNYYKFCC
jgi:peptidoglycan/xylan/chitin deacetylase (PgdA/CDA1 family)